MVVSKNAYICFESFTFYVLISLLDLITRHNIHNQNGAVLNALQSRRLSAGETIIYNVKYPSIVRILFHPISIPGT